MEPSAETLEVPAETVEAAKDWALLHGLAMRPRSELLAGAVPGSVEFVPFSLLPTGFPRAAFEEARAAQPTLGLLMHRVARDRGFLRETLARAARADEFTGRLLDIAERVEAEGCFQPLSLGLLRADYMVDGRSKRCKQVEVNTIASGQGWIGPSCSRLHRYVLEELGASEALEPRLPENGALEGLCRGMARAWRLYGQPGACVLFLVEERTQHIGDQRRHEYELRRLEPGLRVLRRTLGALGVGAAELRGPERRLYVEGREVALVYMRCGYSPAQYPGEAEWRARLLIERSRAVKCPGIGMHLAGSKKVQQRLAEPGVLERFLAPPECARLRALFVGLYSLEAVDGGDSRLEAGISRPRDFVLKPQREGGSNNLFGEALRQKLEELRAAGHPERASWILMERIAPWVRRNRLIRPTVPGSGPLVDVTSELGIFGIILADDEEVLDNEALGHTLRTKLLESDEGGVSSGFGACDSPCLLDDI